MLCVRECVSPDYKTPYTDKSLGRASDFMKLRLATITEVLAIATERGTYPTAKCQFINDCQPLLTVGSSLKCLPAKDFSTIFRGPHVALKPTPKPFEAVR